MEALNSAQMSYTVRSPRKSLTASSRLDVRAGTNSTIMLRYAVDREGETNGGIGELVLASQGFTNTTVTQTLRRQARRR